MEESHQILTDFPSIFQVVMVVGAGRGPLVRAVLSASKRAGRIVKVYAVEKNPNAVLTLQVREFCRGCVEVYPKSLLIWRGGVTD